jgi:hypothetical protein
VENRRPAKSFEDLIVWQRAHQFVLAIYKITENFPKSGMYGITSQLRRSAVSVPANIAESDFVNLVQAADEIGKMLNVYSQKIGSYNS